MSSPNPDDPTLLFTPQKPVAPPKPHRQVLDFVQPPIMASAEKVAYKARLDSSLTDTVEYNVDEIIGEYKESGQLYYYARYKGGIAHKFKVQAIRKKHPALVAEYLRKKAADELPEFDPAAHYVHPNSRVRVRVSIGKDRARASISINGSVAPSSDVEEVPDSEADDDDDEDEKEDDEYEVEDSSIKPRRSTRSSKLPGQNLPFSPKKTRSQKIIVLDSDEETPAPDGGTADAPTRRSTRSHKGFKINLDEGAYYESDQENDDSEGYESAPKLRGAVKRPKVARKKGARPAYGHVRGIEDLEYDPNSDEETAALRVHRNVCEKCHEHPAHEQLAAISKRKSKGRGRSKKRKTTDDEFEESGDEAERASKRGGWVRCHWNCLARTQQDEILKAAREIDRAAWRAAQPEDELQDENGQPKANPNEPRKRSGLDPQQTTDFICGACTKGGVCMGCMETALEPDAAATSTKPSVETAGTGSAAGKDVEMADATKPSNLKYDAAMALLFRCLLCKRLAHYEHMPTPSDFPSDSEIADIAVHYTNSWLCADCASFRFDLDKILAWRPYPANAVEPPRRADEVLPYKTPLPREYLVKWADRSYRRTQWVPHMWLVSTNAAKLKNFLADGSKVELLEEPADDTTPDEDSRAQFQVVVESRDSSVKPGGGAGGGQRPVKARPQDSTPDAERRIPPAWKTVDRVLDLLLWRPRRKQQKKASKKGKGKAKRRIESDDDGSDSEEDAAAQERVAALDEGEEPSSVFTESLEEWEERNKRKFSLNDADDVAWIFVKWDDLTYDEATWDSPPRSSNARYYPAFKTALGRFIASRQVFIPEGGKAAKADRSNDGYARLRIENASELDLGQDPAFKLMDFQVDGFNWLCDNWWNRQQCILADEMGLGKTVQIATFIGKAIGDFGAKPALVVVPNSTITNWVREFERWAPKLRVVPFYGEAKCREVIKKYELSHSGKKKKGCTSAKFHVLVTTYETLTGKDFTTVFKNQPRWEILVVDEGQRLKSDSSLLFRKLNELKTLHRIIMTGTPLNNNIRELFNLMNFLDPAEWNDLEALAQKHEVLTEDLVKDLHNRLRPYFLRRVKSQVLKLPPKNEVIVPVSMAPLQKEIYRSILSHNLDLLNGLTGPAKAHGASKGKLNNVLMHLRKCLQHPYLYEETIEPRGLPEREAHEKLIDASAKLRFLKVLLPKLKARGHRVLLFSQFVIALNVIEDFLNGEGHRFLRLDGNTKGKDRQKGMDEFNRDGSDIFIYLLTTRAGGVGINLFTADTVIIFDPDFNPHQDLQAIARAYRYGQKNTCLVFKLMVKDSAEERIVQVGKKKLVLDHLIVQKMDDDDDAGDNVESILTYGAQALFEADAGARDITYTDTDIDKLIDKTEQEAEPEKANDEGALSFSFAKVWAAEKDTLEDVVEEEDQGDSWAQTLQKINEERERVRANEMATSGRGARRRAAAPKQNAYLVDDSPVKDSGSRPPSDEIESAYGNSSDSEDDVPDGSASVADALNEAGKKARKLKKKERKAAAMENGPLAPIQNLTNQDPCTLCGLRHGDQLGECMMTERSEHLAEFREMLLLHPEDEPFDKRVAAIRAIDEVLHQRGHMHLVLGQPLEPVERTTAELPPKKKPKPATAQDQASRASGSSAAGNPAASSSTTRPPAQPPNAVASSSKRTLSPTPAANSSHKKARTSLSAPLHYLRDLSASYSGSVPCCFRGSQESAICAKLVTNNSGRREDLQPSEEILNGLFAFGFRFIITNEAAQLSDYVVADSYVSTIHCIVSVVRSQNGGVIVSCQDLSRNGILLNDHRICRSVVILMHGDKLQLPNSITFTCQHIWKDRVDKLELFDPTPPPLAQKARTMTIGKYLVTSQKLGSGSFATVHLALDTSRTTRRQVACKTIRKKKGCDMRQVFKEISILNGLQHSNINRIYDTEEDDQFMFIFLQLCTGGDLFTYITAYAEKESHLCEAEGKFIMYQILIGLLYLHSKMISHRDLKPENILLYAPGPYPRIVLADFGLARPRAYQETLNVCGTVSYLPPEGILALDHEHLKYTGMPSDCWSAGVILYIMLSGSHPFDNDMIFDSSSNWLSHMQSAHCSQVSQNYQRNEARLKAKIIDGVVEFKSRPWNRLPDAQRETVAAKLMRGILFPKARDLVNSLLVYDYRERATVNEALQSRWIQSELDDLNVTYQNQVLIRYH
ncbi:Chromatin remodeling factor mit1 [Mycena venus]|uniref:Chromatin remodeling factor mit1 n=1 Tax=Mycena venus TaxID=2733690 RepID=A0A8H6XFV3_9AGAR|nr:Chromatin remodeling factor mit1 [Mycena venus]